MSERADQRIGGSSPHHEPHMHLGYLPSHLEDKICTPHVGLLRHVAAEGLKIRRNDIEWMKVCIHLV